MVERNRKAYTEKLKAKEAVKDLNDQISEFDALTKNTEEKSATTFTSLIPEPYFCSQFRDDLLTQMSQTPTVFGLDFEKLAEVTTDVELEVKEPEIWTCGGCGQIEHLGPCE